MSTPLTARAEIVSEKASGYLQQLCKHFQHKRPVTFDPAQGRIEFTAGVCALAASRNRLVIDLTATDPESLPMLKDVVERHLLRFAFREELAVSWV